MTSKAVAQPATTEVLIVGGGPAGLAASIALRQRGIDCTVVEARPAGIEKACGEGLMPDSREVLAQLGVPLHQSDGHLFPGIRFENSAANVEARFSRDAGIGVRRPHLHALLSARAQQAGACLLWNTHIQLPEAVAPDSAGYRSALVGGRPMRFRWLIGADGQASSVRKWAGLDRTRSRSLRYGFRTHYRIDPATTRFDMVEVHWGRKGQLYLTPVAPDCVCAVYITRDPHCDRGNLLAEFPRIAKILQSAEIVTAQRGAVSASCKLHRVTTDFVALIGDASGSADAITGEGLAITFRQSLALADSIHSGSLSTYTQAHRQIGRLPHAMGELMLTLDRWPRLQVRAIRGLASSPLTFQDLLRAHMGEKRLATVLARRLPRFGWSLLTQDTRA
jgi:flavin-dependent dehydrogenase